MVWISNGSGGLSGIWLAGGTPGQGAGIMLRSTGNGAWAPVAVPGQPILRSLRARDPSAASDIYGVGTDGALVHWNGTSWSHQASGTTTQLNDIAHRPLAGGGWELWVVGNAGIMLRGSR
jgi:hypothetical protein